MNTLKVSFVCVFALLKFLREREREIPIQAINMNNNKISFCKVHDKWDIIIIFVKKMKSMFVSDQFMKTQFLQVRKTWPAWHNIV